MNLTNLINNIHLEDMLFSKPEIDKAETTYRKRYNKAKKIEEIFNSDKVLFDMITKVPAVCIYMKNQFNKMETLQSGFVVESVICQTVANKLHLNNFISYFSDKPPENVPNSILKFIDHDTRFVYYNDNFSIAIVQKGNPFVCDAVIYLDDNSQNEVEIKGSFSRTAEESFGGIDNNGCITYDEKRVKYQRNLYFIKKANKDFAGHPPNGNQCYELETEDWKSVYEYFERKNIKLVLTHNKTKIIAFEYSHENVKKYFEGVVQIRTKGKNNIAYTNPNFDKELLYETIKSAGLSEDDEGNIFVKKNNPHLNAVVGKGTGKISRLYIDRSFFAYKKYTKETKNGYLFPVHKIKQTKTSISTVMNVKKAI